jgi:pimeloyl-ACP methyl ester carboxylesterase
MDVLGIERPWLWGHSDGAVIALWFAIMAPDRVRGVIAEATHFWRRKPASRTFFETMRDAPDDLAERVGPVLQGEHGDRWRALLALNGRAWLRIADEASTADADLYDGRLVEVRTPVLLIHGAKDPRTEPGELTALESALPAGVARLCLLADAGHSPHSERASAAGATAAALAFTRS